MANSNKIIPFRQVTLRKKSEFRLKTELSIYICRTGKSFTCDCISSNEEDTIEDIVVILKKILKDLSKKVPQISFKKYDSYKVTFSLLYYEREGNNNNWKYIFLPQDMNLEKLTEYIYTFTSIYEYKKSQH